MSDPQATLSALLDELKRAGKVLAKHQPRQVTNREDLDFLKATAHSWFRSHRPLLYSTSGPDLSPVDKSFQWILEATDRATSKTSYLAAIKDATLQARALRSQYLLVAATPSSNETPPNFSALVSEAEMQAILSGRWKECQRCLSVEAHLAATVMMGGLLEALFVARANSMLDKAPLFRSMSAPIDPRTKKPLGLKEWTLRAYIDVGHELGWITKSGKDIAVVLRDYRNLVHPEKQRSQGIHLTAHDSNMFWEITKSLSRQLLDKP